MKERRSRMRGIHLEQFEYVLLVAKCSKFLQIDRDRQSVRCYLRIIAQLKFMESKFQFLVDRSSPFGPEKAQILDEFTLAIKNNTAQGKEANDMWRRLKEDHYFWYNADKVVELCSVDETKVFMLVLLEEAIKQKWWALPQEQRGVLRSYIVNLIIQLSQAEGLTKSAHNILSKCNSILVQIVKYEWNNSWKSFIPDICASSVNNLNVCENNFYILKMLSEEIFDHSKNQMTQLQIQELKAQMNKDFTTIFELCKLILENMHQAKATLLRACLETLNAFLSWIPMYYIIYSDLIDKLVLMFPSDYLRNHALACLVEIASLPIDPQNEDQKRKFLFMLQRTTEELHSLLPLENDDERVRMMLNSIKKKNRNIFEILARGIANFYSEFFKNQHRWLERSVSGNEDAVRICQMGFKYLLMMMKVDEDQVFKITIDFFHYYVGAFLESNQKGEGNFGGLSYGLKSISLDGIYQQIFRQVMQTVCLKMAKPEQVLIVIDEDGIPVREEMENTENTSLYEIEKELGQFLVRYNWQDMKKFILQEIEKQHQGEYFNYDVLNSLSWTIGSLCGSIQERQERAFFISTLRNLLQLCEIKKGKENKAVIASCIMYVVGQYPSFLRHNWTFLKTVIKKLFEFMKEEFPGIMEMACNAFLKIAKSTADQFTVLQTSEREPYIREIIRKIPQQTLKLSSDTLQFIFYESVGHLISAENNPEIQLELIKEALGMYLFEYQRIIQMAQNNPNLLKEQEIPRKLSYFLKINEMIAMGVGSGYAVMLDLLSETMNNFYLFYSGEVNQAVATNGKHVLNFMTVRSMRLVKKEVIKVYTRMLQKANDLNFQQATHILNKFIFPLGELLNDFQQCIPETKEQEFVALFTVVLEKLNMVLSPEFLSRLIEMIFTSSLPLITSDFNSFPEIRANFFSFLKSLVKFNFAPLFSLEEGYFNTILDCVIWSLRHELSTYSDLGLDLLEEILTNVNKNTGISNVFYSKYHMRICTDILDVMTDGFHKSGLDSQAKIFYILVHVTTQNIANDSIAPDKPATQSNADYLYNFLVERLALAFPNVHRSLTSEKVANWFKQTDEKLFKLQIADYLVLINRFCPGELQETRQ